MTIQFIDMPVNNLKTAIKNKIFAEKGLICHYCGIKLIRLKHVNGISHKQIQKCLPDEYGIATIDHLVPFKLGGNNEQNNLVPCCLKCNHAKGEKPYQLSFIGWLKYLAGVA